MVVEHLSRADFVTGQSSNVAGLTPTVVRFDAGLAFCNLG
jgi:hypothetical protein